jgi:hypothetical protein
MVNIRVGLSESSAFELAYHIFGGRRTPVLFLVWKQAPIKTTLLRELHTLCDVTYLEFDAAEDLIEGLKNFFTSRQLGSALMVNEGLQHGGVRPANLMFQQEGIKEGIISRE